MNPAFEYLRQFKKVSDESEELVMKVVKKRYPEISLNELVNIFEQGITGDLSGTWGTTVNDAITSLIDSAVASRAG